VICDRELRGLDAGPTLFALPELPPMKTARKLLPLIVSLVVLLPASSPAKPPRTARKSADDSAAKAAPQPVPDPISAPDPEWLDDYGRAMKQAELGQKMLLIYFYAAQPSANQQRFEHESLADYEVSAKLHRDYVCVRLPLNYVVSVGGEQSRLLDHAAFAELHNAPGIAIIDYAHQYEEWHGYVVSILPINNGKYYRFDPRHLTAVLKLPAGTLTQRTMIFAVRVHPEGPQSTNGHPDNGLFDEAREHSHYQARIRNQGHHHWGQRFQRIVGKLPFGLRAKEVVAESWPGEGLVDAAVDCVDCWRQSSGHWSAVRSDQKHYGYDIKRGDNGIWYATGLFGDHRN
jgi:hypothetical protein